MKHENDKKTIKLKNIRSTLDDEIRRRKETEDTVRQYDNQFAMIRKLLSSRDRMSLLNEEERSLFNFQQQGSESVGYDQTHSTLAYPPPLTPNQQDIATVTAPLVHTHARIHTHTHTHSQDKHADKENVGKAHDVYNQVMVGTWCLVAQSFLL